MTKYLVHPEFSRIYLPEVYDISYYVDHQTIYFDTPEAIHGMSRYNWDFKNLQHDELVSIQKTTWKELMRVVLNNDDFFLLKHPVTGDFNMPSDIDRPNRIYVIVNRTKIKNIEVGDFCKRRVYIKYNSVVKSGWGNEPEVIGTGRRELMFENEDVAQKFVDDYYADITYFFNSEYLNDNKVIKSMQELL